MSDDRPPIRTSCPDCGRTDFANALDAITHYCEPRDARLASVRRGERIVVVVVAVITAIVGVALLWGGEVIDQPRLFDPTPPTDPVHCPRCAWEGDGAEMARIEDE